MSILKRGLLLSLLYLLSSSSAEGQFGVRAFYTDNTSQRLDNVFSPDQFTLAGGRTFNQGYSISLDYWLRLPNYRVEFYPYLYYSQLQGKVTQSLEAVLKSRSVGIGVNTHIYFLDLEGDCDCPTFSKQNGFVKKGIFALAGAGIALTDHEFGFTETQKHKANPSFRLGLGIDIGVSDLITISPILQFNYYPLYSWPEVFEALNVEAERTPLSQIQFGVRVGFRPDYK